MILDAFFKNLNAWGEDILNLRTDGFDGVLCSWLTSTNDLKFSIFIIGKYQGHSSFNAQISWLKTFAIISTSFSLDVKDFRPVLVANYAFNSFLSYTTIILNIVTIHAIRKTALLPKPLRTLLLSLAASDVGVGLLVQPFYISTLVSRLNKKRIDCISYKILLAAMNFFCISSLLNVVTISLDRFLAVHLHLRYQELVTHERVIAAVILKWLFSAVICSDLFWAQ